MSEVYSCNTSYVRPGEQDAYLHLMTEVTNAATALGGAREGLILHDLEDPTRFIVIRRWDSPEVLERWVATAEAKALWAEAERIVARFEGSRTVKVLEIPAASNG